MSAGMRKSEARQPAPAVPSATRAHDQSETIDFTALLETLVASAPQLVQSRSLLPAFDWRNATPDQVERLLERLADDRMMVPAWLARGLLSAGHKVPPSAIPGGVAGLQALASLSCAEGPGDAEAVVRHILDMAQYGDMEAWVASSLVARLVALGHPSLACRVAWNQFHVSSEPMRHIRKLEPAEMESLPTVRVRIAGAATTHDLAAALKPTFAAAGWRAEVSEAGFGSVISELLRPGKEADVLVVLLSREIVAGIDWRSSSDSARRLVDEQIETLLGAMKAHCEASSTPLLVNTLVVPTRPTTGHVDNQHELGEAAIVASINRSLSELAARMPSLHLIDSEVALSHIAPDERRDPKLWHFGRIAYSEAATRSLARGYARAWQSLRQGSAKVLAIDFDNTLWGGIFGDDGLEGLQCGDDFPGNAYKALQLECLRLKSQGMILVGLSKNNSDAAEVFARHPGMALREDDFVASAINWEPKADNLRRLAAELGLGLDSCLFLDDSPHEREAMRRLCPAVIVPEMPADPAHRPGWLRSLRCTWPLRLTDEDARRSDMYIAERKGRELRETSASYDEYLSGLQQRLVISPVGPATLARAAQLHQRTNQFNLTGLRLTEAEIAAFTRDERQGLAFVGQVQDRFGDYGIVLAASVEIAGTNARILSFVMSCRVIGRQLEAAFLEALVANLSDRGVEHVEGRYCPTKKNGMVCEFYAAMGFRESGREGDTVLWQSPIEPERAVSPRPVAVEWKEI